MQHNRDEVYNIAQAALAGATLTPEQIEKLATGYVELDDFRHDVANQVGRAMHELDFLRSI